MQFMMLFLKYKGFLGTLSDKKQYKLFNKMILIV